MQNNIAKLKINSLQCTRRFQTQMLRLLFFSRAIFEKVNALFKLLNRVRLNYTCFSNGQRKVKKVY